jgi:hypothetical protein
MKPVNESDAEGHEKKHQFRIFIDAVQYHVDKTSLTGAELKAIANIDAKYQLYLEEQGDRPDKAITDTEAVSVREDMHFYAIPPATMGSATPKGSVDAHT